MSCSSLGVFSKVGSANNDPMKRFGVYRDPASGSSLVDYNERVAAASFPDLPIVSLLLHETLQALTEHGSHIRLLG